MVHLATFAAIVFLTTPLFGAEAAAPAQSAAESDEKSSPATYALSTTAPYLDASVRYIKHKLGHNDWEILYDEKANSEKIVTSYFTNLDAGTDDPTITKRYTRRLNLANKVGNELALKLASFCTAYGKAPKKTVFLAQESELWLEIVQVDIQRTKFLINEYPNRLLSEDTKRRLQERYDQINAIITNIDKTNES